MTTKWVERFRARSVHVEGTPYPRDAETSWSDAQSVAHIRAQIRVNQGDWAAYRIESAWFKDETAEQCQSILKFPLLPPIRCKEQKGHTTAHTEGNFVWDDNVPPVAQPVPKTDVHKRIWNDFWGEDDYGIPPGEKSYAENVWHDPTWP